MLLLLLLIALQSTQTVALKRFQVVRINPQQSARMPKSLAAIFVDPVPNAEPVDTVEEAATRAGFTPRLPKSANKPEFGVMDPVRAEAKISAEELNTALKDATAADVTVPQGWENATISIQQSSGILADYGDFLITQSPPMTISGPQAVALDRFMEVVLRIAGVSAADAAAVRQKFSADPAALFPIPIRYNMDVHEVQLNSGPGLVLQNEDKVGQLALAWGTADRTYFLTGFLSESQVIDLANSISGN